MSGADASGSPRRGEGWLNFTPPLPPGALLKRPRPLPFPFDDPRCRAYGLGRDALWHGLRSLGLEAGDEVLMPAYHCGSEVGAALDLGLVPRYWGGTDSLAPDAAELEALIGPATRALYLIHYLGLAQDGPRWRAWCDEHDLLLVEDVAQGWPSAFEGRPLGSWGDISIYSPRKTFGLPDAGALLAKAPPAALPSLRGVPLVELAKGFLRWPMQHSSFAAGHKQPAVEEEFDPTVEYAIGDPNRGISAASMAMLRRLVGPDVGPMRARNYDFLAERLGDLVPACFPRESREGCPFGLPIVKGEKRRLLSQLAERGISALDFWSVRHPSLPAGAFPEIDRLRETVVMLPAHHYLRERDLDRIARTVLELPA